MPRSAQIPGTLLFCGVVLCGWMVAAVALGLSPWASQRSSQLLTLGAVDSNVFVSHQWWRFVVSQLLHVHGLHMLFNVGCILVLGAMIEVQRGTLALVGLYLLGGTAGQVASTLAYPTLVNSGASQALMSLCAAALFLKSNVARASATGIVLIQVALDVYVSGTVKMGHAVGFSAGLVITLLCMVANNRRAASR
ncbi:MAG TPA: rhomboid family intramembrane serine protease [Steroidobacteraceae bacterium]|nr:rhomboid family intramembrane serine protease [Steroidobacteraceae bacterium]